MTGSKTVGHTTLQERLEQVARSSPPAARRVARFVLDNRALVLISAASAIAAKTGTSDATVVRTVQALGFEGLPDLKRALAASLGSPDATPADGMRSALATNRGPDWAIDSVIEIQREAMDALSQFESRTAIKTAVELLHPVQRIFAFGLGPTASIARYIALVLGRTGRGARVLDATGSGLADQLLDLRQGDGLIVFAYGRRYREVTVTFAEALRLRLPIVLVTDSLDRSLARHADVVVSVQRGRAGNVALHGITLVAAEAILMGLAAAHGSQSIAVLERLNDLRAAVLGSRGEVG